MALRGSFLSVQEAAARMGVDTSYVSRLLRQGRLKGQQVGGVWLVERESLGTFKRRPRGRPRKAKP